MDILLNGERVSLEVDMLADAVVALGFAEARVAVAVNETFVARAQWPSYRLQAEDRLEVLSPIEGG